MNFLIAVTIRNPEGLTERQVYRVPPEATMMDVVNEARQRSELTGALWCSGVEILGTLQPHLYGAYVALLDPLDVTDMVEGNPDVSKCICPGWSDGGHHPECPHRESP